MARRRGPVGALALCQALLVTNNISIISLGTLVAYGLASNKAWSTLPATMYIAGGAASSYLLSMLMKKHGRRFGFTLGTIAGMIGTAICTLAVAMQSFWIFCLGALVAGVYIVGLVLIVFAPETKGQPLPE